MRRARGRLPLALPEDIFAGVKGGGRAAGQIFSFLKIGSGIERMISMMSRQKPGV